MRVTEWQAARVHAHELASQSDADRFGIGGLPLMIKIELPVSPGLGKAYRSVRSRRASPLGNAESGKEKWCEMGQPLIRSGNNEPELEQRPVAQQNDLVEYLKGI
jgi:hypothetical protein